MTDFTKIQKLTVDDMNKETCFFEALSAIMGDSLCKMSNSEKLYYFQMFMAGGTHVTDVLMNYMGVSMR